MRQVLFTVRIAPTSNKQGMLCEVIREGNKKSHAIFTAPNTHLALGKAFEFLSGIFEDK